MSLYEKYSENLAKFRNEPLQENTSRSNKLRNILFLTMLLACSTTLAVLILIEIKRYFFPGRMVRKIQGNDQMIKEGDIQSKKKQRSMDTLKSLFKGSFTKNEPTDPVPLWNKFVPAEELDTWKVDEFIFPEKETVKDTSTETPVTKIETEKEVVKSPEPEPAVASIAPPSE